MNGERVHGYVHSDTLSKSKTSSDQTSTSQTSNNNVQNSGKTMKVRPGVANVRTAATTTSGIAAKLRNTGKRCIGKYRCRWKEME